MEKFAKNIRDARTKIDAFARNIVSEVQSFMEGKSEESVNATRDDIISKGETAHGSLSAYSERGKRGSRWKDVRERAGKQTGYKDLFFSGSLMMNFTTTESKVENNEVVVRTGINEGATNERGRSLSLVNVGLSEYEYGSGTDKRVVDIPQNRIDEVSEQTEAFISGKIENLLESIKI